jgi:hypothetical protein
MPPLSNPSENLSEFLAILQFTVSQTGFAAHPSPTITSKTQAQQIVAALVNPMIENARKVTYNRGVQWGEDLFEKAQQNGIEQENLRELVEKLLEGGGRDGIRQAFVEGVKAGVTANMWGGGQ